MVISEIVAPLTAPQVGSQIPAPNSKPTLHPLEELILARMPRGGGIPIWHLLNQAAKEVEPKDQRRVRIVLWHRLKYLIQEGVLHRIQRTRVSFDQPMPPRTLPRPTRRSRKIVGRANRAPRQDSSTQRVELAETSIQQRFSHDDQLRRSHQALAEPDGEAKSATTVNQEAITAAGRALAYLRHHPKKWVGSLRGIRLYRGMPVQIPTGEVVFVYGKKGKMLVWTRRPGKAMGIFPLRLDFGALPVDQVLVPKQKAAALMGTLKAEKTERPSTRKR